MSNAIDPGRRGIFSEILLTLFREKNKKSVPGIAERGAEVSGKPPLPAQKTLEHKFFALDVA